MSRIRGLMGRHHKDDVMDTDATVATHYSQGDLLRRLNAALAADGVDPEHPSLEALAPYDHFHNRGVEATQDCAALMPVRAGDRLLDIGSGLGGPARFLADRFGCQVTGIDLMSGFCDVARHLSRLLNMEDRTDFVAGDALAMPFGAGTFDGAYSMNVSMNIADKAAFYREIRRVLKPGGWLLLSEIALGEGGEPDYPTPWASSARTSFLATADDTRRALADAGFEVLQWRSTLEEARAFGDRSRAIVKAGGQPPHRAVMLIHGSEARAIMANSSRATADGRMQPIEVLARSV
jgi:ubiquinone/menaquinone biosynthesis C-methylase UbiE